MARQHGTGRIYIKHGAYYGRWRTLDGRYVNRRLGKVRERGGQGEGLSKRDADRLLRRLMEAEGTRREPTVEEHRRTATACSSRARASPTARTANRCSASTFRRHSASAASTR